jgi:hypothetical protein
MAELNKAALTSENNNSFPNNNTGFITPTLLREFNQDMIDSMVDEISYNSDSASFNTRINAITASAGGVTEATFNTYTSSNDSKVNSLIAATGSYITSAQTSSMSVLSSSFALTASIANNVVVNATNGNASTLNRGTVVRITGANGDNPIFNSASWDNDSTSANTLGILQSNVVSGATGSIVVTGIVVGVDTDAFSAGDVLYLSSSGQFTNVQPQAPLHIVTLGEVLRVQQNNGSIFVNISNGWELNELHNVRITNPQDGQTLVYSSSLWINASAGGGSGSIETGSFATTGSNTFKNTQTIDLSATSSTTAIAIIGNATEVITDMYVDGGNYDTFNVLVSASNGIQLRDFDGANTVPFLSVETNGGNVSIPRTTNITGSLKMTGGSLIASGNIIVSGAGTVAQILGDFNAKVNAPALSIGTTNLDTLFESTASGVTSQIDFTRLGAGPTGDLTAVRLQTLSGSDTSGDTLLSRITTGVNRHTSTQMTGSVVNTTISSTWATGSGGTRVAYTSQINANAQSASATLTLNAGNATNNFTQGTASISAGFIRIGSAQAHRIEVTGSTRFVGNTTITGSLNVSSSLVDDDGNFINGGVTIVGAVNGNAIVIKSGSFALTTPQGSGSFYSNCPITSSGLRINGVALVNDLIISGVFSGNSSLQVTANASVSGNLFVSGAVSASIVSASSARINGELGVNGNSVVSASYSNRGIASVYYSTTDNVTGSYVNNFGQNNDTSVAGLLHVVNISSASMATLLSTAATNANTIYFVI